MSFMNMGEEFTTLAKERAKVAELQRCHTESGKSIERMVKENRALEARVAELEEGLMSGMPSAANTGHVPQDGKWYRVWHTPGVIRWEAGPNVWNDRAMFEMGSWHAANPDGWMLEPDQSGEGESDV